MKRTSQIPSSTSLMPRHRAARTTEVLTFFSRNPEEQGTPLRLRGCGHVLPKRIRRKFIGQTEEIFIRHARTLHKKWIVNVMSDASDGEHHVSSSSSCPADNAFGIGLCCESEALSRAYSRVSHLHNQKASAFQAVAPHHLD
jgi:hypothetical protein